VSLSERPVGTVPAAFLPGTPGPADSEGLVRLDLRIADGRIAALAPLGSALEAIDLDGGQVWPGFVDAHVHLDKTQIWPRAANRDGTHAGARVAAAADREGWSETDIKTRFAFGLACAYAHGTVAMRTHIDSYWPHARLGWRVFRTLCDAWARRITLQASSICPLDYFMGEAGIALADEVANSGGVLGMVTTDLGDPHKPIALDVQDQLDRFFALAEERGLALDLHIDETGDTQARVLHAVASTALRRNFRWPVQCGHCCALAWQSEEFAAETIRLCADAGIAIVALPMCNMYLQGRNPGHTPRWRGSPWSTSFAPPACRSRLPSGESGELPAAGSSDLDASAPMKRQVPPAGWRYSITSSVLARIVCGIVRPSNPAVLG